LSYKDFKNITKGDYLQRTDRGLGYCNQQVRLETTDSSSTIPVKLMKKGLLVECTPRKIKNPQGGGSSSEPKGRGGGKQGVASLRSKGRRTETAGEKKRYKNPRVKITKKRGGEWRKKEMSEKRKRGIMTGKKRERGKRFKGSSV